jgi:HD-like signal output (HDOD) protein
MERGELERKVGELVNRLPALPGSVDDLLSAALEPGDRAARVAEIARADPVVCAELLHLAGQCGTSAKPVETIEEALATVDVLTLAQMVGASQAHEALSQEFVGLAHLDEFFEHSREIAETVRILARVCRCPTGECEGHAVAGLLHDLGRLIILVAGNQAGTHLIGTTWDQMLTITSDERRLLGMDHCQIGAELCRRWSFAPDLREGVLRHHSPLDSARGFSRPGAMLFLAHFVAGSDFSGDILARMLPEDVFAQLGLGAADFDRAKELYRAGEA